MIRLDAVNRVLVSAQLQPVAALTSPDRDTSKAITFLDDTVTRELEKGWGFNTNYDETLTAVAGAFTVPAGTLSLDVRADQSSKEIVVRNGALYDKTNNTAVFTEPTIKVDRIIAITFDNCPLVFQEWAVARASVIMAVQRSVDTVIANQLRDDESRAWRELKARDTQQSGLSVYNRWPLNMVSRRWPRLTGALPWGRG